MAYRNKANGFYANHHVVTGSLWYNNTAYRNSTNYNMLSQQITKSLKTGNDTTIDCPGINHVLRNNLSFKYSTQRDSLNIGTSSNTFNTFSKSSGVVVDANDFLSIDEGLLIAQRQSDGSLPNVNFLKIKQGSDLIDKGADLGFSFFGTAPDFGAFETNYATDVEEIISENQLILYPNPVNEVLFVKNQQILSYEIVDLQGKIISRGGAVMEIDVSFLPAGFYFLKVKTITNGNMTNKIIKL
jgi:predicted Rdx family selenoprotein